MTAASPTLNSPSFWSRTGTTGTSDASKFLQEILNSNIKALRRAETWNTKGNIITELIDVFNNHSTPNWDGYGAEPIFAIAYDDAVAFINALPTSIPLPEILPEPDGSIGLEWDNGANKTFTVLLNGKGLITYAGILGKCNKAHGTETFDDTIPENITRYLKRIYS